MKKTKVFNIAIASAVAASGIVVVAPTQSEASVNFSDVTSSNTHAAAIIELAERNILKGYTDGTFGVNKSLTRGQAAKIIANILKLDTKNVVDPGFLDVKKTDEYYGAIAALKANNIISGRADGTYGQYEAITRGQMAKIIVEAFDLTGSKETPFTDLKDAQSFVNYIETLYANGVTTGTSASTYSPLQAVKRGQFASFVVRAEKVTKAQEETPQLNVVSTEVGSIQDGLLNTENGSFEIAEEVAAVFNDTNAKALEDSSVVLEIEYGDSRVASLQPVAVKKGKVVGVRYIKLVKENTNFSAPGFNLAELVVGAKGLTIEGITVDKLEAAAEVTLKDIKVEKLQVVDKSIKIEILGKVSIQILDLPTNVKIEDIIPAHSEVDIDIKDVINGTNEDNTSGEKNEDNTGSGSSGNNQPTVDVALDAALDEAINNLITNYANEVASIADVAFNSSNNKIVITFKPAADSLTSAEIRELLVGKQDKYNFNSLVKDLTADQIDKLLTITSVNVAAGKHSKEFNRSNYFDYTKLDIKKDILISDVDQFIDGAHKANGVISDIKELKNKYSNKITIKASGLTYTVEMK